MGGLVDQGGMKNSESMCVPLVLHFKIDSTYRY